MSCLVRHKGLLILIDSVTVTATLTGGNFDLYEGTVKVRYGLYTHLTRQCNIYNGDGDGVARCEKTFTKIYATNQLECEKETVEN